MALARDLVELEARLRKAGDVDLFAPIERGGLMAAPESAAALERVSRIASSGAPATLRLCLQALRVQANELKPRLIDAEFVATLPESVPGLARPTGRILQQMVEEALEEIVILGYEFTDRGFIELLAAARSRGVEISIICDRNRGGGRRVIEMWPKEQDLPRIYEDREDPEGVPFASMHAKCLLVDQIDLLITSANFTFHGLHGNIEIGVRLKGGPASEARKVFMHLVERGIVERATS